MGQAAWGWAAEVPARCWDTVSVPGQGHGVAPSFLVRLHLHPCSPLRCPGAEFGTSTTGLTREPLVSQCRDPAQHCSTLSLGGRGGQMLVVGPSPVSPHGLCRRCLLLGSRQRGEVFSAKDHPLVPPRAACLSLSAETWRRGRSWRLPRSRSICWVLSAQHPGLTSAGLPSATHPLPSRSRGDAVRGGSLLSDRRCQRGSGRMGQPPPVVSRRVTPASASA